MQIIYKFAHTHHSFVAFCQELGVCSRLRIGWRFGNLMIIGFGGAIIDKSRRGRASLGILFLAMVCVCLWLLQQQLQLLLQDLAFLFVAEEKILNFLQVGLVQEVQSAAAAVGFHTKKGVLPLRKC